MKVISHRGWHVGTDMSENTMGAFDNAFQFGLTAIETDVRLSGDGQLILYHDRCTRDGRAIEELTRSELERIIGHDVPTLEDILRTWPEMFWNIEIKAPAAAPAVLARLAAHPHPDKLLVTSFRHDVVAHCAETLPVACGLLLAHRPRSLSSILDPWQGYHRMNCIVWNYEMVDPPLIDESSKCGYQNFVYGVNSSAEHRLCESLHLSGIITDFPQRCPDYSEVFPSSHGGREDLST